MSKPITWDKYDMYVVSLSPLRERRLLQMAATSGFWHKAHYPEYLFLTYQGYTEWVLGTAFITKKGVERLKHLLTNEGK